MVKDIRIWLSSANSQSDEDAAGALLLLRRRSPADKKCKPACQPQPLVEDELAKQLLEDEEFAYELAVGTEVKRFSNGVSYKDMMRKPGRQRAKTPSLCRRCASRKAIARAQLPTLRGAARARFGFVFL